MLQTSKRTQPPAGRAVLLTWLQLGSCCTRGCRLTAGCAGTPQPAPVGISVQHQHAQRAGQQLQWGSISESQLCESQLASMGVQHQHVQRAKQRLQWRSNNAAEEASQVQRASPGQGLQALL